MKRLLVWYLPQAALFTLAVVFLYFDATAKGEQPHIAAMIIVGVMLAAAYTGGANLVISLVARLRANRGQPRGESDGLSAGRGLLRERPQDGQSVRIDKQLR